MEPVDLRRVFTVEERDRVRDHVLGLAAAVEAELQAPASGSQSAR